MILKRLPGLPRILRHARSAQGQARRATGVVYALFFVGALSTSLSAVRAEEPIREFLNGLYSRGLGEAAVDYVTDLGSRTDLPPEVREILDLEMAKSLRVAALETVNADEAAVHMDGAAKLLDKFLKSHANHAEAPAAFSTYGEIALGRAQKILRTIPPKADKEQREKLIADARKQFETAHDQFALAAKAYLARLIVPVAAEEAPAGKSAAKAPKKNRQRNERAELERIWVEAQLQRATTSRELALTYPDLKDKTRIKLLDTAYKEYDVVFQRFRSVRLGLYAQMFEARIKGDLNDYRSAEDILDELLSTAPEKLDRRADEAMAALYSEATQWRFHMIAKQGRHKDVIAEGDDWLKDNKALRGMPAAEAVALEIARSEIAVAEKAPDAEKKKIMKDALLRLADVAKYPTPSQQDAILLRRLYAGQGDDSFANFAEGVAVGDAASSDNNWTEAAKAYTKALELDTSKETPSRVQTVRLSLARALSNTGKLAEAVDLAEKIARDKGSDVAPTAGALAVNMALSAFVSAPPPEKEAARKRLQDLADYTVTTWSQRSEADDARLALGRLQMVQGNNDAAIKIFEGMNRASERYPQALQLAGQSHWQIYLLEQKKPPQSRIPNVEKQRTTAAKQLEESIQLQRKTLQAGAKLPRSLIEATVLLAETKVDENNFSEALELLKPLLEDEDEVKRRPIETYELRLVIAATRAALGLKDMPQAVAAVKWLAVRGDDQPMINSVLIGLVQQLLVALKSQAASSQPAVAANAPGAQAAPGAQPAPGAEAAAQPPGAAAAAVKPDLTPLATLMPAIAEREKLDPMSRAFLADLCNDLAMPDAATLHYQAILAIATENDGWAKTNAKIVTHVRLRLLDLFLAQKQFPEALEQADTLLKENPKKLEPWIARGRALQGWAAADPTRYEEAIKHWSAVRLKLRGQTPLPAEYYEAVYSASFCLVEQGLAQKSGALKPSEDGTPPLTAAEQLLKSTLVLSPKLSGPEMLERFNALLERIATESKDKTAAK